MFDYGASGGLSISVKTVYIISDPFYGLVVYDPKCRKAAIVLHSASEWYDAPRFQAVDTRKEFIQQLELLEEYGNFRRLTSISLNSLTLPLMRLFYAMDGVPDD